MSPFEVMLVGHLIGDYLFQTSWMAGKKAQEWLPLIVHCLVYTLSIYTIALIGFQGLSLQATLFIFVTHVFLDRRTFVHWWVKNVMRTGNDVAWLYIMADQVFHILVLAIVALYMV